MIDLLPGFVTRNNGSNPHLFKKKGEQSVKISRKQKLAAKYDPDNTGKDQMDVSSDDEEEDNPQETAPSEPASLPQAEVLPGFIDSDIVKEREELKRRLREKLNALRAKRSAPPLTDEPSLEPPKKRVKTEKNKKKEKRKKKHKQPPTPSQTQAQGQSQTQQSAAQQTQKPQQQNDIEYGKFDIGSTGPVPTYLTKRKPSKTALLKQAQEKKQKLQELKGTEEGEALIKQEAWTTAKKKLIGEKVFDDPDRLKKSIKRDEQKKKKSKKEWDQRIRTQRNQQISAQKKREENISAAKEKRKERKLGIKPRKPSKRAGFEGEKKQVINK